MSRPRFEDAVLLAARHVYRNQSAMQKVRIEDICRGVARIYGLPSLSPTQLVSESRLEEGKAVRRDGRPLSFGPNDTRECLDVAVIRKICRLEAHNLINLDTHVADRGSVSKDDLVQLTEPGLRKADAVKGDQMIVDSQIVSRAEWDDPLKTPRDDPRLIKLDSRLTGKFTPAMRVSEETADREWSIHLGSSIFPSSRNEHEVPDVQAPDVKILDVKPSASVETEPQITERVLASPTSEPPSPVEKQPERIPSPASEHPSPSVSPRPDPPSPPRPPDPPSPPRPDPPSPSPPRGPSFGF
jgi:hypothetical protein